MLELEDGSLLKYPGAVKLTNLVDWLKPYSLKEKLERETHKVNELFLQSEIKKLGNLLKVVRSY